MTTGRINQIAITEQLCRCRHCPTKLRPPQAPERAGDRQSRCTANDGHSFFQKTQKVRQTHGGRAQLKAGFKTRANACFWFQCTTRHRSPSHPTRPREGRGQDGSAQAKATHDSPRSDIQYTKSAKVRTTQATDTQPRPERSIYHLQTRQPVPRAEPFETHGDQAIIYYRSTSHQHFENVFSDTNRRASPCPHGGGEDAISTEPALSCREARPEPEATHGRESFRSPLILYTQPTSVGLLPLSTTNREKSAETSGHKTLPTLRSGCALTGETYVASFRSNRH